MTTRRAFLGSALTSAAAFAAGSPSQRSAYASRAPNIVFILIDDLGWSDLACYGHPWHETPHIDALAEGGMRFTNAYAACPVCSPTRASILSGQYPARLGLTDFIPGHWRPHENLRVPINRTQHLPKETVTIAELLHECGYVSGMFGKWHLGGPEHFPKQHGFDESLVHHGPHYGFRTTPPIDTGEDEYLADVLTARAEAFIEAHREQPFFLYLSHYGVHIPLQADEELVAKYEAKPAPNGRITHPVYAAMVEHIDRSVGRIVAKLHEAGLEEDTLLMLYSDNGGLTRRFDGKGPQVTSNEPLRDEKGSLYEGGIRVPLIARWPGTIPAGHVCPEPVTSPDLLPSFAEAAGLGMPAGYPCDGMSLLPLLTDGQPGLGRSAIYWHYPHYHHSRPASAMRAGRWKLIEFLEDGRLELYDLQEDIGEQRNLAEARPEAAKGLQQRLAAWRESVDAPMPEPNPDYDPAKAGEWGRRPGRA